MQSEMTLISVNVGLPRLVASNGGPVLTGIFKEPVSGRVMLRTLTGKMLSTYIVETGQPIATFVEPPGKR